MAASHGMGVSCDRKQSRPVRDAHPLLDSQRPVSVVSNPGGSSNRLGHQVLVLGIGVQVPAPQSDRGYDPPVAAPTVVIMAAGQGTRMHSARPKMLHDLCGRPLVAWPVEAAREAGAGKVVVVGGPDRALDGLLPDGVVLAVQEEARGTGDAVRAAAGELDGEAPVIVLSGWPDDLYGQPEEQLVSRIMIKPVKPAVLLKAIRELVQRSEPRP